MRKRRRCPDCVHWEHRPGVCDGRGHRWGDLGKEVITDCDCEIHDDTNDAAERLRVLMHEADIRWPDEHTRIAPAAFDEWFDAALAEAAHERNAAAALIDVERLTATLWGMKWNPDASVMARKIAAGYDRLSEQVDADPR